ncbi:EpsG family protein, partial [Vibrio sp. 10N.261.54.A5]|uniref:EpsG family protein n=1 Tax=Vibrio sp. 10N.261.54.A5 TaxID=3229686 RepID=UPI00354D281A
IYYITIFLFIAFGYFYDRLSIYNNDRNIFVIFIVIMFLIIYGFRFEVGVDWGNYIRSYYRHAGYGDNLFEFTTPEIGYKLLNIIAYYVDKGIVTVIFLSTALFISFTLFALKNIGLNPFYFFAIVAPYHFVMSGLNYTRQAVALSIFIYAISCLVNDNKNRFLLFIVIAGSFHTSALCFAPLFFIKIKKRYLSIILLLVVPAIVFSMLSEYEQYLEGTMDSAGLYLRALYLIAPSLLLMLHYRAVKEFSLIEKRLIYLVLFSFPLIVLFSILSSTIADRFAYYFILLNTFCWMLVSRRDENVNSKYLKPYGNLILFGSSFLAFIVWTLYTRYLPNYEFDSYFYYWLN